MRLPWISSGRTSAGYPFSQGAQNRPSFWPFFFQIFEQHYSAGLSDNLRRPCTFPQPIWKSGPTEIAGVANRWDGGTYKTYFVRHNRRNAEDVLNNWIRFELIPQRWGFDINLPYGKRFAQVNNLEGKWVVSASSEFIDACAGSNVTLKKSTATKMGVYHGITLIGVKEGFPFDKL